MIVVTLSVLAIPMIAMLWSLLCIIRDRARLRRHHFFALLGGFLMLPVGICYIGFMEMGYYWLISLPSVVFGSVAIVGAAIFARAEIMKRRDRAMPPWACQSCGYDRRGVSGPCPECGVGAKADQPA